MNKRIVFGAFVAMSLFLMPGISHARWMNPAFGRFLTPDSAEGNPDNPISLNKYMYASDDPVNRADPSGEEDVFASIDLMFDLGTIGAFIEPSSIEEPKGVYWDPPLCRPLKEKGLDTKIIQVFQGGSGAYKGPGVDDGKHGRGKVTHFDPPFYPTEKLNYSTGGYYPGTMEDNPSGILIASATFETCRVCVFQKKVRSCGPCKHWKVGDVGDLSDFPTSESPSKVFIETVNKYYPKTIPDGSAK
jgi:hypothetical protein